MLSTDRRSSVILLLLTTILMSASSGAGTFGTPVAVDSLVGEHLEFVIRWGVIPAGRATLEVEAGADDRLVLRATARSMKWIDWMYPVRDVMESTVTPPKLFAERLFKKTKEGRGRAREEEVFFDLEGGWATYRRDEDTLSPIPVPPDVRDPLASFYALRIQKIVGEEVEFEVSDGKKVITGVVRLLEREEITTPAGSFRTVKVEPRIEGIGGVFKKSPGARIFIWLTDDQWRRPVRMRSKVAVGRFTAELTRASGVADSLEE